MRVGNALRYASRAQFIFLPDGCDRQFPSICRCRPLSTEEAFRKKMIVISVRITEFVLCFGSELSRRNSPTNGAACASSQLIFSAGRNSSEAGLWRSFVRGERFRPGVAQFLSAVKHYRRAPREIHTNRINSVRIQKRKS